MDRIVRHRRSTREPQRPASGGHAGAIVEVLDTERNSGERPRIFSGGYARVDQFRVATSLTDVEMDEGVELGVLFLDRSQALLEYFDSGELAASDTLCGIDDRAHDESLAMVPCADSQYVQSFA